LRQVSSAFRLELEEAARIDWLCTPASMVDVMIPAARADRINPGDCSVHRHLK